MILCRESEHTRRRQVGNGDTATVSSAQDYPLSSRSTRLLELRGLDVQESARGPRQSHSVRVSRCSPLFPSTSRMELRCGTTVINLALRGRNPAE